MGHLKKILPALIVGCAFSGLCSATVMLDFDTLATGSDIVNNPLSTADGTITASASGGNLFLTNGSAGGMVGNVLRFDESSDGEYGQLAFDYSVSSLSFLYAGFLSGAFTAQVLDASFNIVDSFYDSYTDDDTPGGPITLSGSDIHYFRFFDGPGGLSFAGVDDLQITAALVPEPGTLSLLTLGLIGLAWSRKKIV